VYEPGCSDVACQSLRPVTDLVESDAVDAVVLIMGLDQSQEREGFDRRTLTLPGKQQQLVLQVANSSAAGNKKPIVLVIMSGGPLDIAFAQDLPQISSILWVGYPGEAGGQAMAEVIFGDHNPGQNPILALRQIDT
jgi:hypothetical protein